MRLLAITANSRQTRRVGRVINRLVHLSVGIGTGRRRRSLHLLRLMIIFEFLVARVQLLHDRLCYEQPFLELLFVKALKVGHTEALIRLLEERRLR